MERGARFLAVGYAALSLAAAACGDEAAGPARGFGSRQLLAVRDPTLEFERWRSESVALYSTGKWTAAQNFWQIDVDSGGVESFGAEPPDLSPAPTSRFDCRPAAGGVLIVRDRLSGTETVIDDYRSGDDFCPPGDDPTLVVLRGDADGDWRLWAGPYDGLQPALAGFAVLQIVDLSPDRRTVCVVAAEDARKEAWGIFTVDLSTFAVGVVVAPVLADAAWAPGATGSGPLVSEALSRAPVMLFDGYLFYQRAMAGGGTIWFAAPYTAGPQHELALVAQVRYDGQQTTEIQGWRTEWMVQVQFRSALGRLRTAVASWYQTPALSGGPGTISVWNSARGGLVTCALPGTPGFWARLSPDGQRVLYQAIPDVDPLTFEPRSGPLLLVNPASADEAGACHLVAEGGVIHADLSPDGASMLWLERPTPAAETALWVAAVDRSAPRRVAAGVFSEALFRDGQRLELLIGGDLVWIDLATDPPEEHPIAERVFGYNPEGYRLTAELWPDLSSAWQVIGYGFSAQDGTGTLGLVNRDTGVARSISPSVAWGYGVYDVARSQRVLYLVRGRTPSAQDGLWLATIHPEDRR